MTSCREPGAGPRPVVCLLKHITRAPQVPLRPPMTQACVLVIHCMVSWCPAPPGARAHPAEHGVLVVQPGRRNGRDEKPACASARPALPRCAVGAASLADAAPAGGHPVHTALERACAGCVVASGLTKTCSAVPMQAARHRMSWRGGPWAPSEALHCAAAPRGPLGPAGRTGCRWCQGRRWPWTW